MMGEHIRALKGGRWLHAIDCGDETVLHLAEDAAPRRVRRAYRPEFVAGAASVELVTHRERTFPAKEIVRRAYSRASDPTLAAMFADSQAFAEWCTTGRAPASRNVALVVPGLAPAAPPATRPAPPERKPARPGKAKRKPAKAAARPARRKLAATAKAKAKPRRNGARTVKRAAAKKRRPARR